MHIIVRRYALRTTLDLPEDLLKKAIEVTHSKTKTEAIKRALINIIQQETIKDLKKFRGKIDLDIDLDRIRKR